MDRIPIQPRTWNSEAIANPADVLSQDETVDWGKFNTSWWLNHPFEKYARQIGSFVLPQLAGAQPPDELLICSSKSRENGHP